jgi:hypothetical protein
MKKLAPRRHRRLLVVLGTGILSVATLIIAGVVLGTPADVDASAVRKAVTEAIRVEQTAPFPPSSYTGGPMSSALQEAITSAGRGELARYFADPELSRREAVLRETVQEQASGEERWLSGGIDNVQISDVTVSGTTAQASASAEVWAQFAQVQPGGKVVTANPHNTMLYTFVLEKRSEAWVVTEQVMKFAPGSEP